MKIFVTGATGFVGTHLVKTLAAQEHEVFALVRSKKKGEGIAGPGVSLTEGTLENVSELAGKLPRFDGVIHLAGLIKATRPYEYYRVNTEGTRNLLTFFQASPPDVFVFLSSLAARGPNATLTDPVGKGPVSHYGKSKLMAEQLVNKTRDKFPVVIVRAPIVYGPGDIETLSLFKMFKRGVALVPGHGERWLSFVHVEDLVRLIVQAVGAKKNVAQPLYPADSEMGHSLGSVLDMAEPIWDRKIRSLHIPLSVIKIVTTMNDLFSLAVGRPRMLSRDKSRELREPYWICSPASCFVHYDLSPFRDLRTGFAETKEWYEQQGWL